MIPSTSPCCPEPTQTGYKGNFCRCCGAKLTPVAPNKGFCNRKGNPCPDCYWESCGPHYCAPPRVIRRYCEQCRSKCNAQGRCPNGCGCL